MKYFEDIVRIPELPCSLRSACVDREPVFFDIETTGLSPRYSYVYLIGSISRRDDQWVLRQWFSEGPDEEPALLEAFAQSISDGQFLLHYNGSSFDLPFLAHRAALHSLPLHFPTKEEALDLMTLLAPIKTWYSLPNRKQRTLEPIAGYRRVDPYDGGTLIAFYAEYVGRARFDADRAEALLADLLRHNREDLMGLATLSNLFAASELLKGSFEACKVVGEQRPEDDCITIELELNQPLSAPLQLTYALPAPLQLTYALPAPLQSTSTLPTEEEHIAEAPTLRLAASDTTATLTVPVLNVTAKHYFANYRDYCSLPLEERCVHKSLASRIPSAYRIAATKETAFETFRGFFLPQFEALLEPVFCLKREDPFTLFPLAELSAHPEQLKAYAAQLLRTLGTAGSPTPKDAH